MYSVLTLLCMNGGYVIDKIMVIYFRIQFIQKGILPMLLSPLLKEY